MNTKQVILLCVMSVAVASPIYEHAHDSHHHHEPHDDWHEHKYAPAHYKYEYGVHDPHTGDIKEAKESSDGQGGVKGYYKLKEADGTTRIVHYHADKHNGFNAHVEKVGHAHHHKHHDHLEYHGHHDEHHYEHHHDNHHHDHPLKLLQHGLVEEIHYHAPPHHYHGYPYTYGYYAPIPDHDIHVYHNKHHAKSHQAVSLKHH